MGRAVQPRGDTTVPWRVVLIGSVSVSLAFFIPGAILAGEAIFGGSAGTSGEVDENNLVDPLDGEDVQRLQNTQSLYRAVLGVAGSLHDAKRPGVAEYAAALGEKVKELETENADLLRDPSVDTVRRDGAARGQMYLPAPIPPELADGMEKLKTLSGQQLEGAALAVLQGLLDQAHRQASAHASSDPGGSERADKFAGKAQGTSAHLLGRLARLTGSNIPSGSEVSTANTETATQSRRRPVAARDSSDPTRRHSVRVA